MGVASEHCCLIVSAVLKGKYLRLCGFKVLNDGKMEMEMEIKN